MKSDKELWKDLLFCFQLGFQVIGAFLLAVVVGLKLDKWFNTRPIILLVLLFSAFVYIITILLKAGR